MKGDRWRHKKRGTYYQEIGRGTLQIGLGDQEHPLNDSPMVFYRAEVDDTLWCRSVQEFEDGRFEKVPQTLWHRWLDFPIPGQAAVNGAIQFAALAGMWEVAGAIRRWIGF